MSNEELIRIVSKRLNKPQDQIEHIYKSWINSIRYYTDNPNYSKTTIRIPLLGSFRITPRSVLKHKDGSMINYYNQFNNKKVNERSKSKKKHNDVPTPS